MKGMIMKKIMSLMALPMVLTISLSAHSKEPASVQSPGVVSATIDPKHKVIDMNGHEYGILRVSKEANGANVKAAVIEEVLASCRILTINQSEDSIVADVIVGFDFENDGGYNYCSLKLIGGSEDYTVRLETKAGE
jgi:hypothetical protein